MFKEYKLLVLTSEKEVEKIFSVNVYSQYWTVFEFLPRMLRDPDWPPCIILILIFCYFWLFPLTPP